MNKFQAPLKAIGILMFAGIALPAGAGMISIPGFTTVATAPGPATDAILAITLFITDPAGELVPDVSFDQAAPNTAANVGDETSSTPREVESIRFLDVNGAPGETLLRFAFPAANPWMPGEELTFHFTLNTPEDAILNFNWQFEFVPTPGAASLLGFAVLLGARRRRS